ncbi:uncharacterized protein LOC117182720 isoform X2 [Belonocnema kinseyi]|uniref:uncharacterized protein LOC117182720 isoform X2 n=1 Tax=Belonocnema kinseyi TaxID=2817044 RepID=UPI00143E0318|nr:uncharacterized protein LOC117182720 isoform X2 [Belonocnema kinseyi]
MSATPDRGFVPHRQRHRHYRHERRYQEEPIVQENSEEKRPKVNPIFLWASQHDQKIVEVRCEDYDKRNRIKLTKTAQGWRSIPRTASNTYPVLLNSGVLMEIESKDTSEKENGLKEDEQLSRLANGDLEEFSIKERVNGAWISSDVEKERRRGDEIRKRDEVRKTEIRKPDEFGKRDGNIKEDKLSERNKIRIRDDYRKRKRDEEVLEYVSLSDEIKGWKSGKRRNDYRRQKRKRTILEAQYEERNDDPVEVEKDELEETSRKKQRCIDLNAMGKNRLMQPRVVLEQLQLRDNEEGNVSRNDDNQCFDKTAIGEGVETYNYIEDVEDDEEDEEIVRIEHDERAESQDAVGEIEKETASKENVVEDQAEEESQHKEKEHEMHHDDTRDNENTECQIQTLEHSREEDFQDILQMLDSTSFSSSKLLSSLKSVKLLEELELSLTGIEDDVVDKARDQVELQTAEPTTGNDHFENRTAYFVAENNNIISNNNLLNKNKTKNSNLNKNNNLLNNILEVHQDNLQFKKIIDEVETGDLTVTQNSSALRKDEDNTLKDPETDSSRILKALRNTPGLSVSIATKSSSPKSRKKPSPGGSRSPDSQMEFREKIPAPDIADVSHFRGLSIAIPSSQHRTKPDLLPIRPIASVRSRIESPESTVSFPRLERQPTASHRVNDEDDCDSQVVEDMRKQKEDFLRISEQLKRFHEEVEAPLRKLQRNQNPLLQVVSSRSNEAQAKNGRDESGFRIQDLVEDSKSHRSSAVSPQPSGIPCSPTSRRSSSAYLERLLPSPPCSVSCSEDAKNDLTLKGILSSPNSLDSRECEKTRDQLESLAAPSDSQRQEPNPEAWVAPSREVDYGIPELRMPEFQMTDVQRLHQKQISGKSLFNEAQNGFMLAQQRAMYFSDKQIKGPKLPSSVDHRDHQEPLIVESSNIPEMPLSPASQLRELLKTSGHLIPDPLLVPRHCLPGLAAAPCIEIPKLLTSRPELRLPEALNKPELLRDPNLLVISLAHLQYVLDQGQDPFGKNKLRQVCDAGKNPNNVNNVNGSSKTKPKLSCKPIGKLMPAPMDLSRNRKNSSYPPLLRVRSGLLKQESEVSSTGSNLEEHHLWHPLFSSQKKSQQQQNYHATWHTTLAS